MFGIDVAKWQGTINWSKVKDARVEFAILKITQKNNTVEGSFEANFKGATAVNITLGGYRYVYATNVDKAKAEANALVKVLNGRAMPMGVWLDMEDSSIKVGKAALTKIIEAETEILVKAGYKVGIYCNRDWYMNVLDGKGLAKKYPFWIARYPSNDTGAYNEKSTLNPKDYAVAWQYSSKGKVAGINGNVDMDVFFSWDIEKPVEKPKAQYYPACKATYTTINSALASVGENDVSLAHRKKIGAANGINNVGTIAGNNAMLSKLKNGELKKA